MKIEISDRRISKAQKPLIGLASLTRLAFSGTDLAPLKQHLVRRIEDDLDDAAAWLDLSTIYQLEGESVKGLNFQSAALTRAALYTHQLPHCAERPLHLLVLMAPGDFMANTPIGFLLEAAHVRIDLLYIDKEILHSLELPENDITFVAIAESDRNRAILEALSSLAAAWPRPLVNDPGTIASLTRDGFAQLMRGAPGVLAPPVQRLSRGKLREVAEAVTPSAAIAYPIIARPVGSHAGQGLHKITNQKELKQFLEIVDFGSYYTSPYVDYMSEDNFFRKYRIVLIEGRPFAVHMAISKHWIIHYLNADMLENPANRQEEAHFMESFEENFASRHARAFQAIYERTGLEYVLVDCAEAKTGELLIFEAGTAMLVHAMDSVDLFPYKARQMEKVFAAFRFMLWSKTGCAETAAKPFATPKPVGLVLS